MARFSIIVPPKFQIGYIVIVGSCFFFIELFQSVYPFAVAFAVIICSFIFAGFRARTELIKEKNFSTKHDLVFTLAAFSILLLIIYPILHSANV